MIRWIRTHVPIWSCWAMDGCPPGGWPETQQATRQIEAEIPLASERNWSTYDLVEELYSVDHTGRWRLLPEYDRMARGWATAKERRARPDSPPKTERPPRPEYWEQLYGPGVED